ncbi:hypothetical protein J7E97_27915 [Streptomyces sp. ISL-66]|uniref:hypothetical protein n=1 Tax=Streptomyces sp. ISL-66 TaxID=2819186 RepID=UPI001BEA79D7|nr:hypothetical protein [Streptomyces sp. ISL-66]MBT2471587.1 hypothetical protein [Streptomyces sp. ISL-66]
MSSAAQSEPSQQAPFPLPPSLEEQAAWVEAVLATPGVNVPREALENMAPFLVRPADILTDPDEKGTRRIKDAALRNVRSDSGEMLTVVVRMHGAGGSVWEHNERISSEWHSAANPAIPREGHYALPQVTPFVRVTTAGREKTFAAVEMVTDSRESLTASLDKAAAALALQDGRRTFNLREDLVLNGQKEPGLYIAQHITIREDALLDRDGAPLHPQTHWQWMAVRGNNRTKQRHEIFGISSAEVVTGVSVKNIGGVGEKVLFDANEWLPQLSRLLNEELAKEGSAEAEPESRAFRAVRVAVVEAHLVIGCPTPSRLYRIAQMSNRHDHVHPPLEFTPNDRSRALGRSVLGSYVAEGLLDEKTAEVLSGSAPVTDLPQCAEIVSVSELRDIRSMMLLAELFPKERRKQLFIRRALSEAPPSQLSAPEINRRARAWSALTSESYPFPWNPRIGEVFQLGEIREGIKVSGRPLKELLRCADSDAEALEELIAYRAAHWLAAFDIIDADRGSLTGQKTEDDFGVKADRVRRTVRNSLNAMRNHPEKAVGVLRELASAMDDGDRKPRKVGLSGEPLIEPMSRAWFNREFPKESGTRTQTQTPRRRTPPPPSAPPEDDGTLFADEATGSPRPTDASPEAQRTGPSAGGAEATGPAPHPGPGGPRGSDAPHEVLRRMRQLATDTVALKELVDLLVDATAAGAGDHPLTRAEADTSAQLLFAASTDLRGMVPHMDRLAEPS